MTVEGLEQKAAPQAEKWVHSYGTIDCGLKLMCQAWQTMSHDFTVDPVGEHTSTGTDPVRYTGPRFPLTILNDHPVDVLVIERGHIRKPRRMPTPERWESLITQTILTKRPSVIVESWLPVVSTWDSGPVGKLSCIRWETLGYDTRMRQVNATAVGGAIYQPRLLVTRIRRGSARAVLWNPFDGDVPYEGTARPMSNLLTPPGLVNRRHYCKDPTRRGTDSITEPMPAYLTWITTTHGVRRLLPEELARGLGMDKKSSEEAKDHLTPSLLQRTTSLFHWEYLSDGFVQIEEPIVQPYEIADEFVFDEDYEDGDRDSTEAESNFTWRPPNLQIGGPWYRRRFENLLLAAWTYKDPFPLIREGINILDRHRKNYTDTHPAPKELQVVWWEFPPEHWDALREGSRMNFLSPPPEGIQENGKMDAEQERIGAEFVDELIQLNVFRKAPVGRKTRSNAPLFVIPKAGQVGQWRVIANLLAGGQNSVVGNDPVFLPRVSHILGQLYQGGFSAVVDASKFFYQFSTHPEDQTYLGMLHPSTGELYEYHGLPMGAGNSPALGSRYGLAFVRLVKERFQLFQGTPLANCWWKGFRTTGEFDPKWGHGYVLIGRDGKPSVKIWVFVDDFLIHGPDEESALAALTFFLDIAVEVGLLCHPGKLTPPQQVVKYCGFILDTRHVPIQRAPLGKRERALAMVEYLLSSLPEREFSRLSLAVVTGVLESLVDGTPHRLGHTYLRNMHSLVHPPDSGTGAEPYYTKGRLNDPCRQELRWWARTLHRGLGRTARAKRSGTLVPSWGDGSGTGTGGTLDVPDRPLQMWLGQWSMAVFYFSSNWKELKTLLLTLRQLAHHYRTEVRGTTLFYFTDNSTTYWIAASGSSKHPALHALIVEIKLLEQELDCCLEVVHVPGLLMIRQGTDGLSRGVWMSSLHNPINQRYLTECVFAPAPYDPQLVWSYVHGYQLSSRWRYQDWQQLWDPRQCFHTLSVWFPPPELARQAISFMLEAWVEVPLTTSALFFVPRTLMAFWHGLSRHIVELATIYPHRTEMRLPPVLPIPIVVLYLPPHVRSLPIIRLDSPSLPSNAQWHREQAAYVRGLPPRAINK
jgi:hypothetical protein